MPPRSHFSALALCAATLVLAPNALARKASEIPLT